MPLLLKSQADRQVCADTAFDNSYFGDNFIIGGGTVFGTVNNFYGLISLYDNSKIITTVGSSTTSTGDGLFGLAKISVNGTPLWHRLFKCNITNLYFRIHRALELASGDIIVGGILQDSTENVIPSYVFIKLNAAGSILWQHNYPAPSNVLQPTRQTIQIDLLVETEGGGFVAMFKDDGYGGNNLTCFAADGTVQWSRAYYGYGFNGNMHNAYRNGKLHLTGGGAKTGCLNSNGVLKPGLFSEIIINAADGNITSVKTLCENPTDRWTDAGFNNLMSKKIANENIVTIYSGMYNLLCIVTDSNSNFVRSTIYSMPFINNVQYGEYAFDIKNDGSVAFSLTVFAGTSLLPYFLLIRLDSNLKVTDEYRLSMPVDSTSNVGQLPIYFSPNGNINFFSFYPSYPAGSPGFALVSLPPGTKGSFLCNGKDTTFGSFRYNYALTTQSHTIQPDSIKENVYRLIGSPMITIQDVPLSKRLTCNNVSICDSFKLSGSNRYCLSNDTIVFTAYKNSLCKKNTIWNIDTSFVSIIDKPNDTSIHLKFLKAGTVSLYTSLDGCFLKDSIKINITQPKNKFNLQKDSVLCSGKTLALQASKGFARYNWQDGSRFDNYTVTDTGFYRVTATDSCGNIFSDSIHVKLSDTSFSLPSSASICNTDTFKLQLPSYFSNIALQPSSGASYSKTQIVFYPSQTTAYTISAETKDQCKTEKTILIKLDNCAANIFFPNAFSPNNAEPNNFFKPFTTLPLQHYHLIIYNRLGQKVFESITPSIGWDGRFKEIQQGSGTYIYYCSYKFFNRPASSKKGHCILLR